MTPEESPLEVSAATVAAAYSHLAAVEAVLEEMPREDAFCISAILFYIRFVGGLKLGDQRDKDWRAFTESIVHPAGLFLPGPRGPELAREWLDGPRWTGYCLASSAEQLRDRLRAGGGRRPFVSLPAGDAARLVWLEETVRRYGTGGGSLTACARGAHDQHLGRSRRRREPVDETWLLGELQAALDAAWAVLCPLRTWGSPGLWMLSPVRPRVAHAEEWVVPQPGRDPADPAVHHAAYEDLARRVGGGPVLETYVEVTAVEAVAATASGGEPGG
jgi:hypothetical protein